MSAGKTTPIQANQVKKGMHAILKGRPCKIVNVAISKTGKHGHAKCRFQGNDVFTDKTYEDVCPSTHSMEQPILEREEYDVIDIDEDMYMTLMEEGGEQRSDLILKDTSEFRTDIMDRFECCDTVQVSILSWGDEYRIVSWKVLFE